MDLPISPSLQQVRCLDTSSTDFGTRLCNVLYGETYVQCVPKLKDGDATWLADYLDKALDNLEPSGSPARKCLRELRNICGTKGMLPASYALPSQLLNISTEPFASGGYGEVYKGTHNGSGVCVKRLRVYTKDAPQKGLKAFYQEAVTWKRMAHPNIVPLLGVIIYPRLQLISEWMSGGDLPDYVKQNPDADRLGLVGATSSRLLYANPATSYPMPSKASSIFIHVA